MSGESDEVLAQTVHERRDGMGCLFKEGYSLTPSLDAVISGHLDQADEASTAVVVRLRVRERERFNIRDLHRLATVPVRALR
jgi:hypothetical protein